MKKILKIIFPLKLQLNILQLEEYKYFRLLRWLSRHFFQRNIEVKRKLVFTLKVKQIITISTFCVVLTSTYVFIITNNAILSIICFLFLMSQPYLLFPLALLLIKPYEIINRRRTIEKNRQLILSNRKLKIIGITGSYAKSSTKEILYQILKDKFKTIRTPESFNNIFGIDKFLNYEYDNSYEIFICEMAAYKKGEIKELCYMVPPSYGILSGITKQHLERFGNLANIISTKFELYEAVKKYKNMVFNQNDITLLSEIKKRNIKSTQNIDVKNIKFDKSGSHFTLIVSGRQFSVTTRFFGMAQVKNILLASEMALKLGINPKELASRIRSLSPFASRTILKTIGNCTIVDNTFSSNIVSFNETLATASIVSGKKVLITPGIVELGKEEVSVHKSLGNLTRNVFDKVILVGKNARTNSFYEGFANKYEVEFIEDTRESYVNKITELAKSFDWIFLENDLTQNY